MLKASLGTALSALALLALGISIAALSAVASDESHQPRHVAGGK